MQVVHVAWRLAALVRRMLHQVQVQLWLASFDRISSVLRTALVEQACRHSTRCCCICVSAFWTACVSIVLGALPWSCSISRIQLPSVTSLVQHMQRSSAGNRHLRGGIEQLADCMTASVLDGNKTAIGV